MTLQAVLIGALAETPIHPGAGQNAGTIDLPVAREGGTDYPFVPGSSNKGSTKNQTGRDESWFGTREEQGRIMIGDLRLLLLPLRSSHGSYRWATCPHLLERLGRDLYRAGYPDRLPEVSVDRDRVHTAVQPNEIGRPLLIEEMTFTVQNSIDPQSELVKAIERLIPNEYPHAATRARVKVRLLVMHDDDFAWFARFGLPVHAHNVLKQDTKTSGNLWYEETLPPDTLLYSLATPRSGPAGEDAAVTLAPLLTKICEQKWFQFGGNETTGQGVCRLHVVPEAGEA